jgi:hypothetical protein
MKSRLVLGAVVVAGATEKKSHHSARPHSRLGEGGTATPPGAAASTSASSVVTAGRQVRQSRADRGRAVEQAGPVQQTWHTGRQAGRPAGCQQRHAQQGTAQHSAAHCTPSYPRLPPLPAPGPQLPPPPRSQSPLAPPPGSAGAAGSGLGGRAKAGQRLPRPPWRKVCHPEQPTRGRLQQREGQVAAGAEGMSSQRVWCPRLLPTPPVPAACRRPQQQQQLT